jgi:hypothetical protein
MVLKSIKVNGYYQNSPFYTILSDPQTLSPLLSLNLGTGYVFCAVGSRLSPGTSSLRPGLQLESREPRELLVSLSFETKLSLRVSIRPSMRRTVGTVLARSVIDGKTHMFLELKSFRKKTRGESTASAACVAHLSTSKADIKYLES